jgi:hypothetical protein
MEDAVKKRGEEINRSEKRGRIGEGISDKKKEKSI